MIKLSRVILFLFQQNDEGKRKIFLKPTYEETRTDKSYTRRAENYTNYFNFLISASFSRSKLIRK